MTDQDEGLVDRLSRRAERGAKEREPIDTGGFERKVRTGSLGVPIWLYDLIQEADVDHVRMIELGGRGVLTEAGWVSADELREIAKNDN